MLTLLTPFNSVADVHLSHLMLLCGLWDSLPSARYSNAVSFLFFQMSQGKAFSDNQDAYCWWLNVPHSWVHRHHNVFREGLFLGNCFNSWLFQLPLSIISNYAKYHNICFRRACSWPWSLFSTFNMTEKLQSLLRNAGVLSAFPICLNSIFIPITNH